MVRIIVSTEDPTLNLATFSNASENGMFSVKPLSRSQCYEKLTSICIFSRIGHWKDTCTCMFQFWVDLEKKYLRVGLQKILFYLRTKIYGYYLVMKCFTINWASSSPSSRWISTLNHKIGNDSMEYQTIVISTTAQFCEIPARVRCMIPIQFDGQWTHGRLHVDKWWLPVFWRNTGHLENNK